MIAFDTVRVSKSDEGWGGPLLIEPSEEKDKIVSITGGGIHPIAQQIAEMSGGEAVDGFNTSVPEEEMACVVIDCGGTARAGVYPKRRIPTINLTPSGPTGPLAKYIKEDIYVSGVRSDTIETVEADVAEGSMEVEAGDDEEPSPQGEESDVTVSHSLTDLGRAIGDFVQKFYQAGRDTIDQTVNNIIPFLAFVSVLVGIFEYTGTGPLLAGAIQPVFTTLPGLLTVSVVMALPVLSPVWGPGAVIAQVLSTLLGALVASGNIPPEYALPILFAINPQVGCDFIPVGLSMGETDPEVARVGVPAILWSRLITGPAATAIAFYVSVEMFA